MPLLTKPVENVERNARPTLTHAYIFRLYAPLALSWVFMAIEGPSTTAIVGRLPHKELNSAALLVMIGLSMWIESPVIDLLSTATTLAKNRQHYVQLSKYTWGLVFGVTFAHAMMVLTPLYGFVTLRVLSLPPEVAHQARLGMIYMIPWAGFIGWRRYLQGILIRFHKTRLISLGTFMRVATMSVVGWGLFVLSSLSGIVIAALALVIGVAAETVFTHILSRGTIHWEFGQEEPPDRDVDTIGFAPSEIVESPLGEDTIPGEDESDLIREQDSGSDRFSPEGRGQLPGDTVSAAIPERASRSDRDKVCSRTQCPPQTLSAPNPERAGSLRTQYPPRTSSTTPLTIRKLLAFHMPLTATTMVALIGNPIISAALSKSNQPVLALASWQVVATLVWLCRTIEFALPEVIITLYKDAQSAAKLRQFSIRVGLAISGSMALLAITGGDRFFFGRVLGESDPIVSMAHLAFICAITLPLIGCQQNYIKGMLTAHHLTTARLMSSLVSFSTLVLMLVLGVYLGWTGVMNAAISLNVALFGEVCVLFWFWRTKRGAALGS